MILPRKSGAWTTLYHCSAYRKLSVPPICHRRKRGSPLAVPLVDPAPAGPIDAIGGLADVSASGLIRHDSPAADTSPDDPRSITKREICPVSAVKNSNYASSTFQKNLL
jgi:hypothetical protein